MVTLCTAGFRLPLSLSLVRILPNVVVLVGTPFRTKVSPLASIVVGVTVGGGVGELTPVTVTVTVVGVLQLLLLARSHK